MHISGHLYKLHSHKKDFEHLSEKYQLDPKCGFWVAEAWEGSLTERQVQFVSESEAADLESQGLLISRRTGLVALRIKKDKDMSEPHSNVGDYTGQNDDDAEEDDTQDC